MSIRLTYLVLAVVGIVLVLASVKTTGNLKSEPAALESAHGKRVLVLSPAPATRADDTHSALAVTRRNYSAEYSFRGKVRTVKQLRVGSEPNSWESAWIVWNYVDISRFYYLAIKPNGWEVGKIDVEYTGGQRFMASGETPYEIGAWHNFEIRHHENYSTVFLNGVQLTTIRDDERPYLGGKVGVYTEDAEIQLADVTAPFADDFSGHRIQKIRGDGRRIGPWVMPFLGFGYAAISESRD